MYKRHKQSTGLCLLTVSVAAFVFEWEYHAIAEMAVTVASIAMGVYIAAVSSLLGSEYAKDLKGKTDPEHKNKTMLGVLADYFRWASVSCMLLIVVSCLFLIPSNIKFLPLLLKLGGSLSYGLFAANILLIWYVLTFLINSLGKAAK